MADWRQKLERFLFDYPDKTPVSIHTSLLIPDFCLLLLRIINASAMTARMIYGQVENKNSLFDILQFLTLVGFHITWLYSVTVLMDRWLNRTQSSVLSPKLQQWVSILYQLSICLELTITVMFWAILVDYSQPISIETVLRELTVHGGPFALMLLQLPFNTYQFPKRHLPTLLITGIAYMLLNGAYSLKVMPVYEVISWRSVTSYVYVVITFLFVFVNHLLFRLIWKKCKKGALQKADQQQLLSCKQQLTQ